MGGTALQASPSPGSSGGMEGCWSSVQLLQDPAKQFWACVTSRILGLWPHVGHQSSHSTPHLQPQLCKQPAQLQVQGRGVSLPQGRPPASTHGPSVSKAEQNTHCAAVAWGLTSQDGYLALDLPVLDTCCNVCLPDSMMCQKATATGQVTYKVTNGQRQGRGGERCTHGLLAPCAPRVPAPTLMGRLRG